MSSFAETRAPAREQARRERKREVGGKPGPLGGAGPRRLRWWRREVRFFETNAFALVPYSLPYPAPVYLSNEENLIDSVAAVQNPHG